LVEEHLHIFLVGLLLLHVSSFAIIAATNSFVSGIDQPLGKDLFDLCVFLADCLFLLFVWNYRKRLQDDEANKRSKHMKLPENIQLSERGIATGDSPAGTENKASSVGPDTKDVSLEVKPAVPKKTRINQIDTLKTVVVMNVVFLHTVVCTGTGWGEYNSGGWINAYNYSVEPILMPCMAASSGFVYKPIVTAAGTRENCKLLMGFFVWQALYVLVFKHVVFRKFLALGARDVTDTWCFGALWETKDDPFPITAMVNQVFASPIYHMWYLWALVMWRLMVPVVMELKHPFVATALLSVYIAFVRTDLGGDTYDGIVQRVVGYFPYFVAGAQLRADGHDAALLRLVQAPLSRAWGAATLLVHCGLMTWGSRLHMCIGSVMPHATLRMDGCTAGIAYGQPDVRAVSWLNALCRVPALFLSLVASLAVLTLVPAGENLLARAGKRSLAPYVVHYMIYCLLYTFTGLADHSPANSMPLFAIMAASTSVLFIPQVSDLLMWTLRPPLEKMWLFKQ